MPFIITLDVYQGAESQARYRTTFQVDESAPLSAMAKAEQFVNVQLPDDQYAVACFARRVEPRASLGLVLALPRAA